MTTSEPSEVGRRAFLWGLGASAAMVSIGADIVFAPTAQASVTYYQPFLGSYEYGDGFWEPRSWGAHGGLDYWRPSSAGTPIHAVAAGTVVAAGWAAVSPGTGNAVIIAHADGRRSVYCHIQDNWPVSVGQAVSARQLIARVGNTANVPLNHHLHLEIWRGSTRATAEDPVAVLDGPQPPLEEENEVIQPLHTRVIRDIVTGHIVMLHPGGVAEIGQPLIPDIPSANGAAFLAGQPLRSDGNYWIDLPHDRFGWEIQRHEQLLEAFDNRIRAIVAEA